MSKMWQKYDSCLYRSASVYCNKTKLGGSKVVSMKQRKDKSSSYPVDEGTYLS